MKRKNEILQLMIEDIQQNLKNQKAVFGTAKIHCGHLEADGAYTFSINENLQIIGNNDYAEGLNVQLSEASVEIIFKIWNTMHD